MALAITVVVPHDVLEDGGQLLRVAGTFALGVDYEVRIDSAGGDYCLSGRPGRMHVMQALTTQELRCYTPRLEPGDHDVVVRRPDGSESATLTDGLTAHVRQFLTSIHAVRKIQPPPYRVGPRSVGQED